jgi:hypothetical protein
MKNSDNDDHEIHNNPYKFNNSYKNYFITIVYYQLAHRPVSKIMLTAIFKPGI